MAQARFIAGIRSDAVADRQRLEKEREAAAAAIRKKQSGSAFGRLLGGIGLPLILSIASGGLLAAPMMALAAGAGSRFGSEVGERGGHVGDALKSISGGGSRGMEDIKFDKSGYRYGTGDVISAADEVAGQTEGFGMAQWTNALTDAGMAYTLGSLTPYKAARGGAHGTGLQAGWQKGSSLKDILGIGI